MEGILHLQKQIEGQEDSALKQVVDYLCSRKDLSDKYLNPEKDVKGMASYIREKAMIHAKNGWNFFNDKIVYSWAVTYFLFPNNVLGIEKPEIKKSQAKSKKKKNNIVATVDKDLHDNKVINISSVTEKNKVPPIEQITLFGGDI